jgi:hypothetical protein
MSMELPTTRLLTIVVGCQVTVSQHVPGVDGEYSTAITNLPAGTYVVHALVGSDVVSTLFTVMR